MNWRIICYLHDVDPTQQCSFQLRRTRENSKSLKTQQVGFFKTPTLNLIKFTGLGR